MKWTDSGLVLTVTLQNQGSEPVEFLYSFLEARDQLGSSVTALTEQLPQTIPPDGKPYEGTIKIPGSLSGVVETLSLTLNSYPDEAIQLKLNNLQVHKS